MPGYHGKLGHCKGTSTRDSVPLWNINIPEQGQPIVVFNPHAWDSRSAWSWKLVGSKIPMNW